MSKQTKHTDAFDESDEPGDDDSMYLDEVTGEYRSKSSENVVETTSSPDDVENMETNEEEEENNDNAAGDETVYVVEYIDEDEEYEEKVQNQDPLNKCLMSKHTLLLKQDGRGNESYRCVQCNSEFASMDDFTLAHKGETNEPSLEETLDMTETQWEALDELPNKKENVDAKFESEQEFLDVEKTEMSAPASEDEDKVKGDTEVEGDGDTEKFYCIECQTVFSDMDSAEQHDCPNANEKTDVVESSDDKDKDEPKVKEKEQVPLPPNTNSANSAKAREFKCMHCPRVFSTVNALCSHSRTHKPKNKDDKNQELVRCDICNTIFSSEKNLKFHMRIHAKRPTKSIQDALPPGAKMQYNELNQFFCEICNKSFDQTLLMVHKNMHQNVEEFICGFCNRQFENLSNYEMHMKLHENKDKKKGPPISKSKNLRDDGKLRFPCQYCGHEFARPYEKVKHERVHTGEKPYECEVCGKTFRVAYSLTLHLRTHTNIRPYVCATCNKRFKSQSVYTHHLMTHQTVRAFKCDQCPKTFRTAVQLCGHKNSHKKPFTCPECSRPFSALYAVKVHMRTHNKLNKTTKRNKETNSVKLRCGFCGAGYTRMFALRIHMKEQHNVDMEPNQKIERVQNSDNEETFLITAGGDDDDEDEDTNDVPVRVEPERRVMRILGRSGRSTKSKTNLVITTDEHEALLPNDDIIIDTFHTEEIVNDGDDDDDEWLPA